MKIENRAQLQACAMNLCLPLMERTAKRRLDHTYGGVNDGAGYLLGFAEAFCRPLWGIAPALRTPGQYHIRVNGEQVEVCAWLRECLLDAVDENSPYSWKPLPGMDESSYYNQMKTELAGLMVGLYFARETLWDPFAPGQKKAVADWVYDINRRAYAMVWDCNHIWFITLCLTVLKKFGFVYPETEHILQESLERLDRMYVGGGFYQDGKFGRFDYYNPWAMHTYALLWSVIADESFAGYEERCRTFRERTEALLPYYAHVFETNGCHVPFGRSLTYRFAAAGILPMAAAAGCRYDAGVLRELTLRNVSYFVENAELRDGILPPGFLYEAPQVVETYTSDGGAYWCSKAFLALLLPEDHPFWTAPAVPVPADEGGFLVHTGCDRIHMPLTGSAKAGVTLFNNTAHYLQDGQKTQWFLDMAGYYSKFAYNSRAGFGISTRDEVSVDNMIVLLTPDGTMESHRFGFQDLGCKRDGRLLLSRHVPFANDPGTCIETALLILVPESHLRVHRVRLSQPYRVREGGFCLPHHTDEKLVRTDGASACVSAGGRHSALRVAGSVPVHPQVRGLTPGMNLMAPMAACPAWQTDVLQPGEYVFATLFSFADGPEEPLPSPVLKGERVTVEYGGKTYEIDLKQEF